MNATTERLLHSWVLVIAISSSVPPANAQTLPPFRGVPADAPLRLAQAVDGRVQRYAGAVDANVLQGVTTGLNQPDVIRSLWDSIEGAIGSPADGALASPPLLDVLDDAIGAYMTELGHIAYEIDRHGNGDTVATLAPFHPGQHGSGTIDVGTVGAFRQLQVSFRGEIAQPDGRAPAVVAFFYLLPDRTRAPIPGRLLIPTTGAQPSFRAEIANGIGEREIRDYGWRPRLARTSSILELMIDGRWTRVEDEVDVVPHRRSFGDAPGFCDATCTQR